MSTPLHQAAQKALAALEVCTGRTTGAGVMRVRAIAEVREALANVDQTNTSPESVQKQPGNEHVLRMALDALEYHVAQTRPIERTTLAMGALRAALAAPQGEHDALRCAVGNCMFNGEVKSHTPNCQHSAPQGEPVAWFHSATNQAFTSEPPPGLKAQCRPLVFGDGAAPQPAAPQQKCLSNCETCDYKKHPDGGWCYMFRDEPDGVCAKHTPYKPAAPTQPWAESETHSLIDSIDDKLHAAMRPAPVIQHRPADDTEGGGL